MGGNSIGKIFCVTTFGESHGEGIGAIVDGCPAGLEISVEEIQRDLDRRKPGQSAITTPRKESDIVNILSGVFNGKTLGSPIALFIPNEDARPNDYDALQNSYRPSHADFTYEAKYGIRDHRGGGRSSARTTAAAVAAGAIAKKLLSIHSTRIHAYVTSVSNIHTDLNALLATDDLEKLSALAEKNEFRCHDSNAAVLMTDVVNKVKSEGDSVGGIITGIIRNCPAGLGEPVFDKLQSDLAKAIFTINAVHGFEYGSGFGGALIRGSAHNDEFIREGNAIRTRTNNSGGIQGGISNGMDIYFRVAFKPVATILKEQQTVTTEGKEIKLTAAGRHDVCVVPRAVVIVEAMAAIVLADHLLRNRSSKI